MASKAPKDDFGRTTSQDLSEQAPEDTVQPRQASIVDPHELEGKTLYEKKCILVNREIDAMGMGRYQWCLWALCGFGYLLDLLWAQAFGLVLSPLGNELGIIGASNILLLKSTGYLPILRPGQW